MKIPSTRAEQQHQRNNLLPHTITLTLNLTARLEMLLLVVTSLFGFALCENSIGLPLNGFLPIISTVNPTVSSPEPLPTPAKQTENESEQFQDRIGISIDANEIYKPPDFAETASQSTGIPLQQQTQTQALSHGALSEATMQIAQTITSLFKNQAFANQNQPNGEPSPWKYPHEQISANFPIYPSPNSNLDRRYGYNEYKQEYKPYDYKTYDYKPYSYKPYEYKSYDYKPYDYKHHEYKHDDYKHDYKHHDYKDDYKHDEYKHDYKHHDYKDDYKHDEYKHHDYKDDYKHHDDNKIKAVVHLFKEFKDEAKKASHNLGKKIAEETKEIAHKLGPIVPLAGTVLVGSLAVKLLTRPGPGGFNYFNKYQNGTNVGYPSKFPLISFNGRKKRSVDGGKKLVFAFDEVGVEHGVRNKVKRSVGDVERVGGSSKMQYKLVFLYEGQVENEGLNRIETKFGD